MEYSCARIDELVGGMSVIRIGEVLHPGWVRGTSRSFSGRFWIKRVVLALERTRDLLAALLMPASVVALALGLWRLAADLEWTETFPISNGLFSHWLVWIAIAGALAFSASSLTPRVVRKVKVSAKN